MFLTYKASDAVDRLRRTVTADAPIYDFPGRRRHPAHDLEGAGAGGHRGRGRLRGDSRACTLPTGTTARRAPRAQRSCGGGGAPEADFFIAVAFPDNQMHILPYNRIVKDLAGQTPRSSSRRCAAGCRRCARAPPTPAGKGEVSMFLDGAWYAIDLSKATPADGSRASGLDVALLQQHVLEPLLQIGDVRTDKRIDFVGGARGTAALEAAVKAGRAAVAFSMHPVTIDDLMSISDEGGIMPPKSTWFEPKLRDGLVDAHDMKVLIADKFEKSGVDGLKAAGCDVVYEPDLKDDALAQAIASSGADVLVVRGTKVTAPMLDAGRLSLIVRAGAGYNTIDVGRRRTRGIYVSNCPGKNAIAVAELAFGLILALDRRIPDNVAELRAGTWNKKEYSKAQGLYGRTLALLGVGSIGQEMIRRAAGFGMNVVIWSRRFDGRAAPMSDVEARELGVEAALRTIVDRAGADARRRRGARRRRQRARRAERRNEAAGQRGAAGADEAGRDADQHGARRGGRLCGAGGGGEGARPEGRARRLRQRAGGRDGAVQRQLTALPGVYGTHHIGASTDQAQEAIAAETVRIVRSYKETGRVPNVVNLARRTPATHMLVVRHRDRPGVLAHVFNHLRQANLNVQETENIVFEGAEAAVARINLDGAPPRGPLPDDQVRERRRPGLAACDAVKGPLWRRRPNASTTFPRGRRCCRSKCSRRRSAICCRCRASACRSSRSAIARSRSTTSSRAAKPTCGRWQASPTTTRSSSCRAAPACSSRWCR